MNQQFESQSAGPNYSGEDCRWMRQAWELSSDAILLTDSNATIVDLNSVAEEWIGQRRQNIIGRALDQVIRLHERIPPTAEPRQSVPGDVLTSSGEQRPIRVACWSFEKRVLLVAKPDTETAVCCPHDSLTQLPLRTAIDLHMAQIRNGRLAGRHAALLMIDIDNFKLVNDQFGHVVGDLVLNTTADRLKAGIRQHDLAVRYGGDEFLAIVNGLSQPLESDIVARRLCESIKQPILLPDGQILSISASIGVAFFSENQADIEWIRRADQAMYQAKEKGRSGHVVTASQDRPT